MDAIVQVIHACEIYCNQASQVCKASVVWRVMAEVSIQGGLADWLYHTPTNWPRQLPCAYSGGSNDWMAGNLPCDPCHRPEHCPGP